MALLRVGSVLLALAAVSQAAPPQAVQRSSTGAGTFSADILDSWLVSMQVGTPPQQLKLSLDLGSPGLVVESDLTPQKDQITKYPMYHPGSSSSAKQVSGSTWDYTYGGFEIAGTVYQDTVTLSSKTVPNIPLEVVTSLKQGTPITTASGILGMAWARLTDASPSSVKTFMGACVGSLAKNLFTLWFDSTIPSGKRGQVNFGYIDSTMYTGNVVYTPYNGNGLYWQANIDGIGAADPKTGKLLAADMTPFQALWDTGSEQSSMPLRAIKAYHSAIPGSIYDSGAYTYDYPCSIGSNLPDLVLFIQGQAIVVPRQKYGYWQDMKPSNADPNTDYCAWHIRPSDYFTGGTNMFGQDIIEGIFMVLDYDNSRMGFANSTSLAHDKDYQSGHKSSQQPSQSSAQPSQPTHTPCTYPKGKALSVGAASVNACTATNYGGTCTSVSLGNTGCVSLKQYNAKSVQITSNSNLRCALYSDENCSSPLADAVNILSPGSSSPSQTPNSVWCVDKGFVPQNTAKSVLSVCGDAINSQTGKPGGQGCVLSQQRPWTCETMYAPSNQFKFNMTTAAHASQGPAGTCFFYMDENCKMLTSNPAGTDMCTSDRYGDSVNVPMFSWTGSHICV